jgi:DNA helicase IV
VNKGMATLIPSISTCVSRMTSGERRTAERLEQKLDDDYGIPLLKPVSCGRDGQEPLVIKLPTLQAEAEAIADHLAQRKLPVENRLGSGDFDPTSNKIKVMTMKVSKGLEFPMVALPGVGHMPAPREDEKEAARVFYVAATRATQRLVMGVGGDGKLGVRLSKL